MPFKVEVGPPQIAIHQAQTVLVTDPNGEVTWPSDRGNEVGVPFQRGCISSTRG